MKRVPPTLALLVLMALPGGARAQEVATGCSVDNPLMLCPLKVCLALSAAVHSPATCSSRACPLPACRKVNGCENLKQALSRWIACAAARDTINVTCFAGGDLVHQNLANEARLKAQECEAKIALPRPEGCAELRCN